jgi:hypothetical protein
VPSEQQPSQRFLGYLVAFVLLFFLLYLLPEVLVFERYGFVPVEHIVDAGAHPSLRTILAGVWADRAVLLNPMNNPLVRFFIVTMVVGVVFDGVRKYWPSKAQGD